MATNKVTPKTPGDKMSRPKKVSPKTAATEQVASNGATAVAKAESDSKAGKKTRRNQDVPFNAETAQVLRDADAGKNLLHYPSLEAMFEDLGI
jgi:hypothetical protein